MPVGRYVIVARLGEGGMGAVYSAYDPQLDRKVALKFLHTHLAGKEVAEWHARLTREAQAMARLAHPNVVTVYDVGVAGDQRVFVAMELVEGGTLVQWLKEKKRTWREIVSVYCQAGEGLAAAHGAGMIHRDFKPENVLIGHDGRPRVTDFGLVRAVGDDAKADHLPCGGWQPLSSGPLSSCSLSAPLTMTGSLLGTPGYMAPEQYGLVGKADERADIFAFCASLYRALYGERAFEGETLDAIVEATINGCIRPAPKGTEVPAWLRRVVLRGLEVKPEARPASMRELLTALRADPVRKRRRWFALGATTVAACAVALAVHTAGQRRVRACHAMSDRLGGVWDAPRKATIERAFRSVGGAFALDTWTRITGPLDAYATAWQVSTERACEATRVRGEQSEAMLETRAACLDDRLDELRALSDVLARADGQVIANAVQAVHGLSSLSPCSDLDHLSVGTAIRPEPGKRVEIRALEGEIAEARAMCVAGKPVAGLDRLQRMADRVERLRFDPLLVSWMMGMAEAERDADTRAAADYWERAALLADRLSLDRQRAEALLQRAHFDDWFAAFDQGHRTIRLARAAIARSGGDAKLEVRIEEREGWLSLDEGNSQSASESFQRALERIEGGRVDVPDTASSAHAGLGVALVGLGRFDEGIEHERIALRVAEEAFGSQHLLVGVELNNLACAQLDSGRLEDALGSAQRAADAFERAVQRGDLWPTSTWFGSISQARGDALLRMGRAQDAADTLTRAADNLRGTAEGEGLVPMIDNSLAQAWRLMGRSADARRATEEAVQIEARAKDIPPETIAGTLAARADLAIDDRRLAEALSLAESALARVEERTPHVYALADARLRLARLLALRRDDSTRARSLAEQARAGFEQLHDGRRLGDVAALLGGMTR
jgi:tetratricopeptide (TPR) repeat protein